MYELRLVGRARVRFVAEARRRMAEKGLTMSDLAEMTGRPVNSIYCFFGNAGVQNRFLAAEIAEALGIKGKKWR